MTLSILIATIPERKKVLLKLLNKLYFQITELYKNHSTLGLVEIIIDDGERFAVGGMSIGEKRNKLLQKAIGKYVCFMDEDDDVAPNYIEQLMRMCNEDVDAVTFRTLIHNDYYWAIIDMSLNNFTNEEVNPNGIINRTIWHICPIKSEIAKKYSFDNINHGEDVSWLNKVVPEIKIESHTQMILTQYNHSEENSEADKIIKGDKEVNNVPLLISLAVDEAGYFAMKSIGLENSISLNWKGDVRLYKHYPSYCTPNSAIPYKFKFDLIKKAREDGYSLIFWMDSSMRILNGSLTDLIGEEGIMAFHNLGHDLYKYISDKAVEKLEVREEELRVIEMTWGGSIGFDFNKDKACEIFEEIYLHSFDGSFENGESKREGFIAHRHDQAVASVVFWKHGIPLLPYGRIAAKSDVNERTYIQYGDI